MARSGRRWNVCLAKVMEVEPLRGVMGGFYTTSKQKDPHPNPLPKGEGIRRFLLCVGGGF
jgi:hypothetical protein